ncbi:MAG: hypothetical protein IPO66_12140 [Rhodanobacteraceae bacterium]|nr:hypothetical protein [Rhodanobacteraceae bacterium]
MLAAGNLASAQRSSHFELEIARQGGAATETSGISMLDVAFTFQFPAAIRSEDIALLQINANDVDIAPAINAFATWSFPRSDQIKLTIPLRRLTDGGVVIEDGRSDIAFAVRLQLHGGGRNRGGKLRPGGARSPGPGVQRRSGIERAGRHRRIAPTR